MSATPSPSWYDLLGVEPTAPTEEIRAAWKSQIADLDPTDRRFRVLNQAAEVLLDPEQRVAYDATLTVPPEPLTRHEVTGGAKRGRLLRGGSTGPEAEPTLPRATPAEPEPRLEVTPRRRVPLWLLAGLGLLAAALVAACVWAYVTAPPTDEEVAESTSDAQAAAERAIVAIVSYDYRSLDDDQAEAAGYMTNGFAEDYESLFAVIRENAPETKTIISTEVVGSSIVRSGDDRVQVFLFIDTPTTNAKTTTPEVYKNQVTVTMEKSGDEWLVDDLKTSLPTA